MAVAFLSSDEAVDQYIQSSRKMFHVKMEIILYSQHSKCLIVDNSRTKISENSWAILARVIVIEASHQVI